MIKNIVSIVGRPNVGKSTLFNCLTKSMRAIVNDIPGVTRDRIYGIVKSDRYDDVGFIIIDTGGFENQPGEYQPFADNIVWQNTQIAIKESNLILFVLDAKAGLLPQDKELHYFLLKQNKPIVYVLNKVDNPSTSSTLIADFFKLGIENFCIISAAHQIGILELKEHIETILYSDIKLTKQFNIEPHIKPDIKIAIIGRPNVGKSSILNRLVGENRAIVSDIPGTTRDTLDTPLRYKKKNYLIIDTAGIRKKSKIKQKLEGLCIIKSLKAIERADINLLVIDAKEFLSDQDKKLASIVIEQYKPLILIVNKWDLILNKTSQSTTHFENSLRSVLAPFDYIPIIFVSCLKNQRISKIMPTVEKISQQYLSRANTSEVNQALEKIIQEHNPALSKTTSKQIKFYYATQIKSAPPTIIVKCNLANELHNSYKKYMINKFRNYLGFKDIPIKVLFSKKDYKEKNI